MIMTRARAYYNEIDPAAAHILRAMIDADVIAPGDVDTRSIKDVQPDDLSGYTQCHFFAGGGLWSVAARLAGWPDDRPLWTGSCPCQPFSVAGKGLGTDDPRHLWPDFHRLISARRPAVVMGEQVAGKAGYGWFDGVRADLAGEGYASRASDFPACSIDAPHQRNRLYWIAVEHAESVGWGARWPEHALLGGWTTPSRTDARSPLGHHAGERRVEAIGESRDDEASPSRREGGRAQRSHGGDRGLSPDTAVSVVQRQPSARNEPHAREDEGVHADAQRNGRRVPFEPICSRRLTADDGAIPNGTYWSDADWIECYDGKARRAQSGIRFLVDGLPGRVDLWRVGGNAIVPEAAAEVIAAFMDVYGVPPLQSMEEAE